MIKKFFTIITVLLFALMVLPLLRQIAPFEELAPVAAAYAEQGPDQLGAANLVTSVIVTYRGLDTLGEVTVLFIATAGVGFLLRRDEEDQLPGDGVPRETPREASELLGSGSMLLFPLLMLFGVYIFLHGHLTPGGGFQGGVVIASAMLLLMLARVSFHLNHLIISLVESLSGFFYVAIGVLGLILAAGFLDNRILPLGEFGTLLSAGAIPIIYSLVGLKVGTELTNVLGTMRLTRTQQEEDV
ncbi:MAG: Na(+)/H(+) antiporter subunit B [Spirochaetia bacterium]|nr:Na(+)/H(+) antiporter subunit B [Spirochaetia bacterium]